MSGFLVRRALQGVLIVLLVATLAFCLIHLAPGDPFAATFDSPLVSAAVRAQWRAAYGLDRPLPEQYVRYLASVLRGDLGFSLSQRRPVADVLAGALPNTLLLMGTALVGSFAFGILVGVVQALRRGSRMDRVLDSVTLVLSSLPDFWLALVVMLVLAYWLPLFPVAGLFDPVMYSYLSPAERVLDRLRHLALPATALILLNTASIARYQRAAMLDTLPEDYVRTARAKGLPERRVMLRHALRNALLPVITILGLALPTLLGGAVFVETIFAWPGMGLLAVTAVSSRDYALVVATVILGSTLVVAGGIVSDLLYAAADPRLRAQ